jgi:hypothetical protein
MSTKNGFVARRCAIALACAAAIAAQDTRPPSGETADEPRVGIRFEGFLPGTHDVDLQGEFEVEFRIYLSPQGGDAVWSESQRVRVARGRMDVALGTVNPIPFSIHEATFKFLGASVGGAREVYPRFTVVNTVFASPEESLRTVAGSAAEKRGSAPAQRDAYAGSGAVVAAATEAPCTWKEALIAARARGGDLPDYRDWYAELARCSKEQALERSGHYEWVLPWVYDTASHGEYNRLFRGRFQGCDYMDLSPGNRYSYRIALPAPRAAQGPSETKDA